MNKICVYSGSNLGKNPEYKKSAVILGKALADNKIELVYGGSNVGLMGEVSNTVLKNNGRVTGVIPKNLFSDTMRNKNITNLIETHDMDDRKKMMMDISDGFIALPGGLGTYEELFETLSWAQLGLHKKPIGILNISNYFDPIITMLKNTCNAGFMRETNLKLLLVSTDPYDLIEKMKGYTPPVLGSKSIDESK